LMPESRSGAGATTPAAALPHHVPVLISSWLEPRLVARISAAGGERVEVLYEPDILPRPRYAGDHYAPQAELTREQAARWKELVGRAEVIFDFDWERQPTLAERAPNLRWIQCTSSGVGPRVKEEGLIGSPVRVTTAAGIHAQPLAEFVLMAALYFVKEMPRIERWKQEHHWERFCAGELAGTTMVLIGLGQMGRRVAEVSAALGVEVIGHRRSPAKDPPPGVRCVVDRRELDGVLPRADLLVIAAPETEQTFRLIDRARLELLPTNAVVINIGRGSLLDEAALIEMLESGRLGGAALDVFEHEPLPPDSPLWTLPNVIISPHSASTVPSENDRLVDLFVDNLERYLDGRPLVNPFNAELSY
jgi:glyoxylate/hydroxypyruvate reductase A